MLQCFSFPNRWKKVIHFVQMPMSLDLKYMTTSPLCFPGNQWGGKRCALSAWPMDGKCVGPSLPKLPAVGSCGCRNYDPPWASHSRVPSFWAWSGNITLYNMLCLLPGPLASKLFCLSGFILLHFVQNLSELWLRNVWKCEKRRWSIVLWYNWNG